jgi:hypothetical protein
MFAGQWFLPTVINNGIIVINNSSDIKKDPKKNAFILNSALLHTKDKSVAIYKSDVNDLDDKILVYLSNLSIQAYQLVLTPGSVSITAGGQKILDKFVINEASIQGIFDTIFDTIIDPKAD